MRLIETSKILSHLDSTEALAAVSYLDEFQRTITQLTDSGYLTLITVIRDKEK